MEQNAKKPAAAVFATDNASCFALGVTLLSIKQNSPLFCSGADFFVFIQNLSDENKEALLRILPVKFIEYYPGIDASKIKTLARYSLLTLARYECFKMLKDYQRSLWLDNDIIALKEIQNIFGCAKTGIALSKDFNVAAANFFKPPSEYDGTAQNYNAGVMLLDDTLPRYDEIAKWLYAATETLSPQLKWPDQGIINIALQHFKLNVAELPREYNAHPFSYPIKIRDAYILHAMGENKFWNNFPLPAWSRFYSQWTALGGKNMPSQDINAKVVFAWRVKFIIEKIPILWAIFKYFNKKRFSRSNKKLLKQQEK